MPAGLAGRDDQEMEHAEREQHRRETRAAYDALAPVWSATTDDGPYNGWLERPALRSLVDFPLAGRRVLDLGCGAGGQAEWLADAGAAVVGLDLSAAMIAAARQRTGGRASFVIADLAAALPFAPDSFDALTCSLALHYVEDWLVPLTSFASVLRPGGHAVVSLDHPFGPPLPGQVAGYFATELVADSWEKAGVRVRQRFWRRPLGAVIDAFADAGFVLERLREAQPSAAALARHPEELTPLVGVPVFICYRFRLAAR